MRDLVLYTYWRSSSAFRVRFALAVKGLPYRSVAVNLLGGEQLEPAHMERSPAGYVPCLTIDGRPFVESVAIVELLEELAPRPPLLPADPYARASVRALVEIINAGTQPLQNLNVLKHLSDDAATRVAWSRHFITRGFAAFEALMARHAHGGVTGRFAYGDSLTAADVFLVPMLYNARRFDVDLAPYPRLSAAGAAALATDAARAALPENQPDAVPPPAPRL